MPRRTPKPRPAAALARELHAAEPTLSPAELARRVSAAVGRHVRPWQVAEALASSGQPGPVPRVRDSERVHLTLDRAVVEHARQLAAQLQVTLAEVIEAAIRAL